MLQRTEGIVLKTLPLGEADLIVTFLTKDFGIIKTFAKSPRKTKSRFGSSLEPLTLSRIAFWGREDAALPRLTQSDILHPFDSLRSGLKSFLRVSGIIELTLNFIPEKDANRNIYSIFHDTLRAMESGSDTEMVVLYYKLKLLESAGFLPRLDGCARCGKKGDYFFLSHGAILCENCSRGTESPFRVSPAAIRFYATVLAWELSKIDRLKPSGPLFSELSRLIDEHVKYISEKDLRTNSFRV